MSAGRFEQTRYQATYLSTAVHPIRVQPETLAFSITDGGGTSTNEPPADAVNVPISALTSRSGRGLGLRPRFVTLELPEATTPPTGYSVGAITRVPILTQDLFNQLVQNNLATYLGVQWRIVSTTAESAR